MTKINHCVIFGLLFGLFSALLGQPSSAQSQRAVHGEFEGVHIFVMRRSDAEIQSANGIAVEPAALKLRDSLLYLMENSAFLASQIRALQQHGTPTIFYDPSSPLSDRQDSLSVVSPLPPQWLMDYVPRIMPSTITQRGIRWDVEEIGTLFALQIVGEGWQRAKGRYSSNPTLDQQCEQFLYMEQGVQDLVEDRATNFWVDMRISMERHQCRNFIEWLATTAPAASEQFEQRNPNVPLLLEHFEVYLGR